MNEEEESVQKTRLSFEDLCRALNMDEEASNGAWRSYENISKNYTLEVRESCLVLHRALCGHHAGMSMEPGALMCLCVHLKTPIGLITKQSTVCVCLY